MQHKFLNRVIFISLAIGSLLIAQEEGQVSLRQLQRGDRALQFGVSGLFNLRSFQGSTISYKRHFSSKAALRIGVDINLNDSASEGSEERSYLDSYVDFRDSTGYVRSEDELYSLKTEQDVLSIGVVTQWIIYPAARGELQPYWGIGPTAHYRRSSREDVRASADTTADPRITNTEISNYGLGVSGIFGLEWFVRKSMSLTAEYTSYVRASYSTVEWYSKSTSNYLYYDADGVVTRSRTVIRETQTKSDSSRPEIEVRSQIMLGLSLYF